MSYIFEILAANSRAVAFRAEKENFPPGAKKCTIFPSFLLHRRRLGVPSAASSRKPGTFGNVGGL